MLWLGTCSLVHYEHVTAAFGVSLTALAIIWTYYVVVKYLTTHCIQILLPTSYPEEVGTNHMNCVISG